MLVCLTANLQAATSPAAPIPVAVTNALARDILQEIHPAGLLRAEVLAFKSIEDDRPWRVDAALVVAELKHGRWELWHVARNTPAAGKRTQWSEYTISDSTQRGSQSVNHRPTAQDVRSFLKLSAWSFGPEPQFRLTRGELYPATWQSVLGFSPEYRFSAPTNSHPPPRPAK